MGKAGLIVIPILVAFSTFGAANGGTYTSSRSVYGAAKDHLLPDFLSGLHTHYRTPVPAILFLVSGLSVLERKGLEVVRLSLSELDVAILNV